MEATKKKNLRRSRNAKLFGVLGGFAEYYNWNKTWVRIIFILGLVVTKVFPLAIVYLLTAFVMEKEEEVKVVDV